MGQSQLRSYSYSTPHLIYCHSFSFNIPSLPASRSHVSRSYVDSFFCYVCVSLFLVPRVDLRIEYQRSYIQRAAVPAPSALFATASSVFLPRAGRYLALYLRGNRCRLAVPSRLKRSFLEFGTSVVTSEAFESDRRRSL